MKFILLILFFFCVLTNKVSAQNFPWERPLKIAWSADGITFNAPTVFQDSSGVPSVIRWKGDTLISAFQWFRAPVGSPTWDRVAVKFSYDNGSTWTQPLPIQVSGFPANFQRPFDPTLLAFDNDTIRIYFSSSNGIPMTLDSTVNTYSAKSTDGVNYMFEPVPRVDETNNRVIDPALIHFNNSYHYLSPIGSPQQGAYHYVSPNGLNFMKVPDIMSDPAHNWTGNYMINDTNELRFYGAGTNGIWYNNSPNGGMWNGYVNTNINGGDPAVLKTDVSEYMMIYVGEPYITGFNNEISKEDLVILINVNGEIEINAKKIINQIKVYNSSGQLYSSYAPGKEKFTFAVSGSGVYVIQVFMRDEVVTRKVLVEKK
jgi:hypothetical protein